MSDEAHTTPVTDQDKVDYVLNEFNGNYELRIDPLALYDELKRLREIEWKYAGLCK